MVNESEWGSEALPDAFINVRRCRKKIQFQTLQLKKLSQRQEDAFHTMTMRSDTVVRELQGILRGNVAELFRISEAVATLDMMASFAEAAIVSNWVRPSYGSSLALLGARHPILDCVSLSRDH